ncbi:hypothetical protein M758_4G097800 [Ceratodon purpureus]|nr:hypothetical protein M758_4G097800 [Ceratodon purpureus]
MSIDFGPLSGRSKASGEKAETSAQSSAATHSVSRIQLELVACALHCGDITGVYTTYYRLCLNCAHGSIHY